MNKSVEDWILEYFQEHSPSSKLWFEIVEDIVAGSGIPDGPITAVLLNLIEQEKILRVKGVWRLE